MSISIIRVVTKSLLFSLLFTLLFLLALTGYIIKENKRYKESVYPNVYVNDVDFSGAKRQDVKNYFESQNKNLQKASISIIYEDTIATFSGKTLKFAYNIDIIESRAFSIGRSSNSFSRWYQRISTILNLELYTFRFSPEYHLEPLVNYFDSLDKKYSKKPINALFTIKDGRVSAFKKEAYGTRIKKAEAMTEIETIIERIGAGEASDDLSIRIENEDIDPEIKLSDINDLGIVEKVGEGRSSFRGSSPERIHNIELAASRIHGVLISPGQEFSYTNTLGDISAETGYKQSLIIKSGKTILGDGGGVCQDSTTLFRAALDAGLPIIERHAHGYRVRYYEYDRKPGFDATIYSPSIDLRFKNDLNSHILIQTNVDRANSSLTFSLYGKKDGRIIELSDANVYDVHLPPDPAYQDDPGLKRGVVKQIEWAAHGGKSTFQYKVTAADGTIIQDKTFYSSYRPWQAVFLVGTSD
ncbi:hypothetical protein A3H80_01735 [Candidatus Roizmanbacteria bacterium RIFCSPLOWO2_02_FULL_37_19]|uniref:YoaR-like putative peptidoglycan binding domain-containing protein n=1 Tax=Candidatus Roizmanbacteria bacterium RIFCSPHIGHO2_02_FULL_37_24 TaxID=1802037 RepID=A0A1F7GY55_9BACT|nr:MAG: hypothetical protein A2862_00065 [Candidatus Roizmanbacteria bacterium RIFCSPHIGHO2_01_FULL_38_41]OGK23496.1 MAG: hypothetical protein A3C24_01735 [Candidatus Roizmanbacteria bacterium RIFCSPHIGHO2_02_FULL_37_24]OGK33454.1 MAG: hypothetical protein A3E10_02450 [Candidatus Roizmanbacteria bacterium RIFCSPHIGHO2_12_FULL_37_23]OGK43543.1 MAG: hypothetical protein A2956_02390 [Candidatus Roizmanbacteria bacterium RIFCSPLOWO2_01_FULL_37_57]OGK54032.1 MAG: hypothetical protein A3H80_01735 [Ca